MKCMMHVCISCVNRKNHGTSKRNIGKIENSTGRERRKDK